jgi:hypothetical protein
MVAALVRSQLLHDYRTSTTALCSKAIATQGEMVSGLQGGGWNSAMASRNLVLAVPIGSGAVIQALP